MIDSTRKRREQAQKDRVRRRINTKIDPENYEFRPAKKQIDYYDNEVEQRVAVYARVSTGNVQQTTSYELQKKYYEDFVIHHPNWTLVKIYADEGISGTSLAHRDEFNQMISDCRAGKIDMIITKSVSRFARNVVDCISMVRMLAELSNPVGVFFESECIFSLKDDSQMALSFQATMAQEESHIRSRSMETSLRMRLDGGLPLTPKLLGYSHDSEGNLVINPEEESTVRLIFYMYLYGYSTAEIAQILTEQGRKTYLGNVTWTSSSIVQVLRNERHCGDVLTRKTFTPNYLTHKAKKNRGDRPQSLYRNHHEAIVSRDDFIAVQHLLNNAKYGNKSVLPELRVIESGLLRGFVTINPRWAGFKPEDYYRAVDGVLGEESFQPPFTSDGHSVEGNTISICAGDFDMRGFEVTRSELFDTNGANIVIEGKKLKLSTACVRAFGDKNSIELLVNPRTMQLAARSSSAKDHSALICSRKNEGRYVPRTMSGAAFLETLYELFGWNPDFKYRIAGTLFQTADETAFIFQVDDAEALLRPSVISYDGTDATSKVTPMLTSGKRIRAVPEKWASSFGAQYYVHQSVSSNIPRNEADWKLRMEGQLYESGLKLNVTSFDQLERYIQRELTSKERMEGVANE